MNTPNWICECCYIFTDTSSSWMEENHDNWRQWTKHTCTKKFYSWEWSGDQFNSELDFKLYGLTLGYTKQEVGFYLSNGLRIISG